ncbi:hypothetical protein E4U57_001381 [Claviceps arundinis]|uniref:Threonine/serine exporter-like N-terminal domain-containing protein n=1 Tax=Claviceps arundinis TaxID=1623583 RepID=A0ABQ7PQ19_9HYPO|nr:hypothetical protein E4U57_001381 [Claviceps arundinis]
MDRRRGDRLTVSTESWFTDDSMRSSEDEEIHGVMDSAGDHDDHVTQDDAHSASEQQPHSRFESDGVRYRASHSRRHPSTPSPPVVSPRASPRVSPPASESRVRGGPVHMSSISARQQYLIKLSRALIMYGAPPHQLEGYMSMSSRALEIEGKFFYIPGGMAISFARSTAGPAEVKLVKVSEGMDLGRQQDVYDILMDVAHDRLGVEEGERRLDGVSGARPKSKVWFRILMYGLASACVAPFGFEGRLVDLPIAFILGCIVGLSQLVFTAKTERARVCDFLAAVVTSFLARGFGSINNGQLFCFSTLAQSSLVMCLPGYLVLSGCLEILNQKTVAGAVRMVYAIGSYTLCLGCGIPIGAALYGMMDSNATGATHCKNPLSREWSFVFVPCFTICLCIILHAKWRQIPAMLAVAVAGFSVVSYSTGYLTSHFSLNAHIPTMLGALTVAILASLYSRLSERVQSLGPDFVDFWRFLFSTQRPSHADAWPLPSSSDPEANAVPPPSDFDEGRKYSLAAVVMLPGLLVLVPAGLVATGSLLAGFDAATSAVDDTIFHLGLRLFQVAGVLSLGVSLGALILDPLGRRRGGLTSF